MAFINALKSSFPVVKSGLYQIVWRDVQEIRLTDLYEEYLEIRRHIKMLTTLSQLTPGVVVEGWLKIMAN